MIFCALPGNLFAFYATAKAACPRVSPVETVSSRVRKITCQFVVQPERRALCPEVITPIKMRCVNKPGSASVNQRVSSRTTAVGLCCQIMCLRYPTPRNQNMLVLHSNRFCRDITRHVKEVCPVIRACTSAEERNPPQPPRWTFHAQPTRSPTNTYNQPYVLLSV